MAKKFGFCTDTKLGEYALCIVGDCDWVSAYRPTREALLPLMQEHYRTNHMLAAAVEKATTTEDNT